MKTFLGLLFFCFLFQPVFSQTTIKKQGESATNSGKINNEPAPIAEHKVLIIPFEPRLFMCEIGKSISKETGMNFPQINHTFRSGLNFSLSAELKKNYKTISLMQDTAKSRKDLEYIYSSITYKYDLVNNTDEANTHTPQNKNNQTNKKQGIKNGELVVEMSNDKRFMNTKIANNQLFSYLSKKYEADVFLFINELDIKNVLDEVIDINANRFEREISIHYSVFDLNGKELNGGIAVQRFSNLENNPQKLLDEKFSITSKVIADKIKKSITPQQQNSDTIAKPTPNSLIK